MRTLKRKEKAEGGPQKLKCLGNHPRNFSLHVETNPPTAFPKHQTLKIPVQNKRRVG